MLDRSQIMRSAWRRYREIRAGGAAFSRRAFAPARASARATAKARPGVMANVWANYRANHSSRLTFCRRVFGRRVQQAWAAAKMRDAYAAEKDGAEPIVPIAPRPIAYRPIDMPGLGFILTRHAVQPNEQSIRSRYVG